ncbi:hypothetical protein GCM10018954_086800 [Kutzneria kofuensis]
MLVSWTSVISFMSAALSGPYRVSVNAGAVVAGAAVMPTCVLPQAAVDSTATTPHTPRIVRTVIIHAPQWIVA